MSDFVYLDNAATTFPKPPEVIQAACDFYSTRGVNPGRTGFDLALEAEETLTGARQALTDFFGGTDRNRLVFSYNVTDALNLLISSVLQPGDHAVTTCLEHNSVLRPMYRHAEHGVDVDFVPFDSRRLCRSRTTSRAASAPTPNWWWSTTAPTSSAPSSR